MVILIAVTRKSSVKLFLYKSNKLGLLRGKYREGKSVNDITSHCNEINTPFTQILFSINSALNHSFLPPHHISSLIIFSDLEHSLNQEKILFTSKTGT
jgi:hypothetical protein